MSNIIEDQLEIKQQIVTYKLLTRKLNIHPNEAKKMLYNYVNSLVDDTKYSITYVIGGTLKENDEFCMIMAYDDHLETMRRRFKLINFEHIYSIQPIKRFDDINNALYLIDSSSSLDNNVNFPSSIKRKEKENISFPEQDNKIDNEVNISSTKALNSTVNKDLNHSNETKIENKLDKSIKKKTGMDLFVNNNKNKNGTTEETEKKDSPKKKTGLDFFVYSNKNKNTKTEEIEKKVSPKNAHSNYSKNSNNSNDIKTVTGNEVLTENITKDKIKTDIKPSKKNVNEHETKIKKKVNKKENGKKKNNSQKVKRKRIQTFDSSDEEIDSEEEDKKRSEKVLEVEDEIDFVQPTPPRSTVRENRKKEKQITTSTFVDDEGFICTTKEVNMVETVNESPSETDSIVEDSKLKEINSEPVKKKMKLGESDTVAQVDKKKSKTKQPKSSSNQGMKQSSLSSFFFKQNK